MFNVIWQQDGHERVRSFPEPEVAEIFADYLHDELGDMAEIFVEEAE